MTNSIKKDMKERERIEEDHISNILKIKTVLQVPIHLMYLDLCQTPARYQINRFKMNFLQYMLQQEEESLL